MRPKKFGSILLILVAVSCSRQQKMQRDQQNYDVVQEGATGTATTTLAAPGEAPPATATNVDTTTAFTLPETATTTSTAPPGTVAGSLPTSTGGSIGQYTPQPRPVARPHVERPPDQPPMNSSTSTAAPPTTTDTAPPRTDTTATSTQG